jgi:hypothetical protein
MTGGMKFTRHFAFFLALFAAAAHAEPESGSSAALRSTYAALAARLATSPFGRPLVLESRQSDDRVRGAVYAVVDHGFDELAVYLGRKTPQPPEQAQRLDFDYRAVTRAAEYVGGLRGVVERNAMRYYLAIEAHLGALSAPPGARPERSMREWFAATERYPRQLHEIGRAEYLEMKRVEYGRDALVLRAERPR